SGVTPSKARPPSNTVDPSQAPWVRGPMMATLPSCQSPSKKVQVREIGLAVETIAAMLNPPKRRSEPEGRADRRRPVPDAGAVGGEHRHGQPVHAEGDATGVGGRAVLVHQVPGVAEVLAVIVEAHAGGGLGLGADRDQELELQLL